MHVYEFLPPGERAKLILATADGRTPVLTGPRMVALTQAAAQFFLDGNRDCSAVVSDVPDAAIECPDRTGRYAVLTCDADVIREVLPPPHASPVTIRAGRGRGTEVINLGPAAHSDADAAAVCRENAAGWNARYAKANPAGPA